MTSLLSTPTTSRADVRLCTFVVGTLLLGVPVEDVLEVVGTSQLTPVPLAPDSVLGLLNLRGQIVPVVDARTRLGLQARSPGQTIVYVILHVAGEHVALAVDQASDVVTVPGGQRENVPESVNPTIRRLVTASYQRPDGLLLVLNPLLALTDL